MVLRLEPPLDAPTESDACHATKNGEAKFSSHGYWLFLRYSGEIDLLPLEPRDLPHSSDYGKLSPVEQPQNLKDKFKLLDHDRKVRQTWPAFRDLFEA